MKRQIIFLLAIFTVLSCSKDNSSENKYDKGPKINFGYYLGMPRYEYENITGAYLLDKTLRPHWSKDKDKYSLPLYYFDEPNEDYSKWFYGEMTFNLPSDKLASSTLTFRYNGTEWSNESKGLRQNETEEMLFHIKKYLSDLNIEAQLKIIQFSDDGYDNTDTEGWVEIVGYLNL